MTWTTSPLGVKEPNGAMTETGYDAMGQVVSQTDGNKHTTTYVRNPLEEQIEVIDPLGRVTEKEYNADGDLIVARVEETERYAGYEYDPADRLVRIEYPYDESTNVKYEYDPDGNRTEMVDATGTTSYAYDQLDRLVQGTDGHGDKTGYEYDLAGDQTKLTYPSGHEITRAFDNDGRLKSVTDWNSNTTNFAYDPNSNLTTTTFPSATGEQDKTMFNGANQVMKITMTGSGLKVLAALAYTRDSDGQLKTTQTKGLPGEEKAGYAYDSNNRLIKAGSTVYGYDAANNPIKLGSSAYTYDAADELKTGTGVQYAYNEIGERTMSAPKGVATTYRYEEAGNLIAVERLAEGKTPQIKDGYTYDGDGLRASQTVSGATTHMTWATAEGPPALLSDETNSYIYGPEDQPIEQINNTQSKILYLHHDQQGSTRLITNSTGKVEGTTTYDAYGNITGTTGSATSPLGYDSQYTNSDTGLIYLRARAYDPATAQFLSVDPAVSITGAPYNYAGDNPVNRADRSGLGEGELDLPCVWPACAPPSSTTEAVREVGNGIVEGSREVGEGFAQGAESIWNTIKGGSGGGRNPAQDKELGDKEIKALEKAGHHPHELKPGGGPEDLYKDREGNIYVKPKGGAGPGEETGLNLREFGC
jgi:RHS repeat-associated protein